MISEASVSAAASVQEHSVLVGVHTAPEESASGSWLEEGRWFAQSEQLSLDHTAAAQIRPVGKQFKPGLLLQNIFTLAELDSKVTALKLLQLVLHVSNFTKSGQVSDKHLWYDYISCASSPLTRMLPPGGTAKIKSWYFN